MKRGLEVFAAVRPSSDLTYLQDQRIQCLQVNLADVEAMTALFRQHQFDYFIHNAGLTKGSREAMFKVNTQLCDNILKALQEGIPDLKKFVFISSLAAYGPADQQRADEVKEADEPRPITSYGESKLAAEKLLHATSDFPWLVFRPTAVYGPREKDIFTFFSLINKGIEPYIGFQTQQLTFVYVLDLVRVIVDGLLSEHRQKSYFVSDGQAYAALQLGQYIRQNLGKRSLRLKVPLGIVRVIAWCNEKVASLLGSHPALNLEKVKELESLNWKCDIRPLKSDLGFHPQYDLQKGISETTNWYLKHKWL